MFPNRFPTYRYKIPTEGILFRYVFSAFRRTRNGRARRSQSKVCPQGMRGNFVEESSFPHNQNCRAPLTDKAALPTSKRRKAESARRLSSRKSIAEYRLTIPKLYLLCRFCIGLLMVKLLEKDQPIW